MRENNRTKAALMVDCMIEAFQKFLTLSNAAIADSKRDGAKLLHNEKLRRVGSRFPTYLDQSITYQHRAGGRDHA